MSLASGLTKKFRPHAKIKYGSLKYSYAKYNPITKGLKLPRGLWALSHTNAFSTIFNINITSVHLILNILPYYESTNMLFDNI